MQVTKRKDLPKIRIVHNQKLLWIILALLAVLIVVVGYMISLEKAENSEKIIGGDKDSGGCLIAAGYSWNESKQECVREWEEQKKVFCTDESRAAQVCPSLYDPVCGNAFEVSSSSETYGNSCIACMYKDVIYYTKGECNPQ